MRKFGRVKCYYYFNIKGFLGRILFKINIKRKLVWKNVKGGLSEINGIAFAGK